MTKELYRILSGKLIINLYGNRYILNPLSYKQKYLLEEYYQEILEENLQNPDIMSQKDIKFKFLLFRHGLDPKYEETIKSNNKDIENKKLSIYELVKEKGKAEEEKKDLSRLNEQNSTLFYKLHQKDSITAEGMAELCKIRKSIRMGLKEKVSENTIEDIMQWMSENFIREETYRKIARSTTFINIVNASPNVFSNFPLTDEQITLMYWYRFYKNVSEHSEKPFDWVIEDDAALDGWCIFQSRKSGKSESVNYVESKILSDAVRNSEEVYVVRQPGTNMHDEVFSANDATGKAMIKARFNAIERGILNESNEQKLKGLGT